MSSFLFFIIFISVTNIISFKNERIEIVVELNNGSLSGINGSFIEHFESKHGLRYKRLLFSNFHVLEKFITTERSKRQINGERKHAATLDLIKKLNEDEQIKWFEIQKPLIRQKRNNFYDLFNKLVNSINEDPNKEDNFLRNQRSNQFLMYKCKTSKYEFNDPFWPFQWYINDGCNEGYNLNITSAWDLGYTGKGVVISIIDDGVENTNTDLIDNYDPNASIDFNDGDNDPQPRYEKTNENKHGTRCAGEISATANNSICGVGIAYNSRIGGIRILDGEINDRLESMALIFNIDHIDIFSASWGPLDNGKTVEGPNKLTRLAFLKGVNEGRNKKGVIYVWASGNGGRYHDNCNCDGYTASIYTITISSVTKEHYVPIYSEKCASILATTYSSDANTHIITSDIRNQCTRSHSGTSASAPLAAGIIALALEANKNLTWRDVQYLVVYSSDTTKLLSKEWNINGVGRRFNHEFGFGLMNAGNLVSLVRDWVNVGEQLICHLEILENENIEIKSGETKFISVQISTILNEFGNTIKFCNKKINHLEHVISTLTIKSGNRGSLHISLISPSGTPSNLLDNRKLDKSKLGFNNWPFMSVHYWGENPNGEWILKIKNDDISSAYVKNWTLKLHGVEYLSRLYM